MSDRRVIEVRDEEVERLDRFLASTLKISRTQAARLVAAHAVTVNGAVARASYRPVRGDRIDVTLPENPAPRTVEPYDVTLDVAFEDDWLLIVNKPAGMVVHPAPGHWQDTLVNALAARGTRLSEATPERRGIVHRLDRDTSGLMVVAKTDAAHRKLAGALERRRINRIYAALSWGHVKVAVTIDEPMARHPADRKRMLVMATGRPARTHVTPVARFETCDLLRLELETGRTHQIRVHLAHVGHPVVGDPVYGGGGARRITTGPRRLAERIERECPRQALHATELRLDHPETGESMTFRSEWPGDLGPMLAAAAQDSDLVARPQALDYLGFFRADG